MKAQIIKLLYDRVENAKQQLLIETTHPMKAYWTGIETELNGIIRIIEADEFDD